MSRLSPQYGLKTCALLKHSRGMAVARRYVGEFWRGRDKVLTLSILIVRPTLDEVEEVANKKLVGADKITSTELSQAEVSKLQIGKGEVWL